jgi:hypothetical protein
VASSRTGAFAAGMVPAGRGPAEMGVWWAAGVGGRGAAAGTCSVTAVSARGGWALPRAEAA